MCWSPHLALADFAKTCCARRCPSTTLLSARQVHAEAERVLADELRMPASKARSIPAFIRQHAEVIEPSAPAALPGKDPDDQCIVAAATEGHADVLVSGDQDLLEIADRVKIDILSPRGFWEALR